MPFVHQGYHQAKSQGPEGRSFGAVAQIPLEGPKPEETEHPVAQNVGAFAAVAMDHLDLGRAQSGNPRQEPLHQSQGVLGRAPVAGQNQDSGAPERRGQPIANKNRDSHGCCSGAQRVPSFRREADIQGAGQLKAAITPESPPQRPRPRRDANHPWSPLPPDSGWGCRSQRPRPGPPRLWRCHPSW
jgi:hypothetical protein